MPINISSTPPSCLQSPAWDKSSRAYTARKARLASAGDGYWKKLTLYTQFLNFIGASRGPSVVGKAWQESGEHVAAAVLRKQRQIDLARARGQAVTTDVWRSTEVANSLMRQDVVRYRPEYLRGDYRSGDSRRAKGPDKKELPLNISNTENKWALCFGKLAHRFHGICEMFAAPTGMTSNVIRNAVSPHISETGTKNKVFMASTLFGVGLATTQLLGAATDAVVASGVAMGKVIGGLLVAFPAVSSFMGLMGTISGVTSQALLKKPNLGEQQIKIIEQDISELLHKLHHRIDSIKDDPNGIRIVSKAMTGQGLGRKVEDAYLNEEGTPVLLQSLIDCVKQAPNDKKAQLDAMQATIGDYLNQGVDPLPNNAPMADSMKQTRQIESREKHFRALCRLVNHCEIDDPAKMANEDARRYGERTIGVDFFHNNVFLKGAAILCRLSQTKQGALWANKLNHWTSEAYKKERAAHLADPANARANCLNADYMLNHIHQYGPVTRFLLRFAEFTRLINMNLVLASNAQLSRCFNNLAMFSQRQLTGGLASRSMCSSIGRFFGGALLSTIFGFLIPAAADATGAPSKFQVGIDGSEITISFTNIGILMFLLSVPTLLVHGLAIGVACIEGWKGPRRKEPSDKIATGAAIRWGN